VGVAGPRRMHVSRPCPDGPGGCGRTDIHDKGLQPGTCGRGGAVHVRHRGLRSPHRLVFLGRIDRSPDRGRSTAGLHGRCDLSQGKRACHPMKRARVSLPCGHHARTAVFPRDTKSILSKQQDRNSDSPSILFLPPKIPFP